MKYVISTLVCLVVLSLTAQHQQAPGRIDQLLASDFSTSRLTDFWSEDFSEGLPAGWSLEGNADWEYRGPSTDPGVDAGTRGSCIAAGLITGAPIDSESRLNGFMIFDSDYWDSEGPCGNWGSGTSPAPHDCALITNGIDLSAHPFCGLRFTQYARNYNAEMLVEVSADDGPWTPVYQVNLGFNQETDRDNEVQVNISGAAAGSSNVKIRFRFSGTYYFWMIDDLSLFDLEENDLFISDQSYGDFDLNNPDHPTGYEFMEHTQVPEEMVQILKISAAIENRGGAVQQNARMNAQLFRTSGTETLLYEETSEAFNLIPGQQEVFRTGNFTPAAEVGTYQLRYEALSDNPENAPDDNEAERTFYITPVSLARDGLSLDAVYLPIPDLEDQAYELGNVFLINQPGLSVHSLSAGVSVGSQIGSTVYGRLYLYDWNDGVFVQQVAQTQAVQIDISDTNNAGQNKILLLPFAEPVPLNDGQTYMAVITAEGGSVQMLCGLSGPADPFTAWVHFLPDNEWFFLPRHPMIRMNFGPYTVGLEEQSLPELSAWPNPVSSQLTIDSPENGLLTVVDALGRSCATFNLNAGLNPVDFSRLPAGAYTLLLKGQDGYLSGRTKVIKE